MAWPSHRQPDVLVVDDVASNIRVLSDILEAEGCRVRSALSGDSALGAARLRTPDLVLLDVMMPEMDGYEVCRRLKMLPDLEHVPVIFVSALEGTDDKIAAFAAGGVDYITKPFHIEEVRARVRTHLHLHTLQLEVEEYSRRLESLVMEQVKEIADSQMATIYAMARLAESRDDDTGAHLERVRSYCELLAREAADRGIGGSADPLFVRTLGQTSLLHDIGKVAISDSILLKPDKLTAEEFEIIKTHTTVGAATLEAVSELYPKNAFIAMGIDVVRSHHERWDGGGYPDGLLGTQIPLSARIMAVADVYDALRSRRPYKQPFSHADSMAIIAEGRGTHFDPELVDIFVSAGEEVERIETDISRIWVS